MEFLLCVSTEVITAKLSAFWAQFVGWFQSGGAAAAFAAFTPILAGICSIVVMVKKVVGNFEELKQNLLDKDRYDEIADLVKTVVNENYELRAQIVELTELITKVKREVDDYGENTTIGSN